MGLGDVVLLISLVLMLGTLVVKVRIAEYFWRGAREMIESDLYSPDPAHRRRARIGFAIALVFGALSMVFAMYFWFCVVDPSVRWQR